MQRRHPRKPLAAALAVIGILLTSGCFYSDTPLLAPDQYAQPIRAGLWENLQPMSADEWARMSDRQRQDNDCREIAGEKFCGQRVQVTASADGSYQLAWEGEDTVDRVQFAPLSADNFIIQQVLDGGSADYALATKLSPEQFEVRLPDCRRDVYLQAYAAPEEGSSIKCRIADPLRLRQLLTEYLARSPAQDAKLFLRIGE